MKEEKYIDQKLSLLFEALPLEQPKADFTANIMAQIAAEPAIQEVESPAWKSWLLWSAICLTVIGLGVGFSLFFKVDYPSINALSEVTNSWNFSFDWSGFSSKISSLGFIILFATGGLLLIERLLHYFLVKPEQLRKHGASIYCL